MTTSNGETPTAPPEDMVEWYALGESVAMKLIGTTGLNNCMGVIQEEKLGELEQALAFVTPFTGIMGVIVGSVLTWLLLGS